MYTHRHPSHTPYIYMSVALIKIWKWNREFFCFSFVVVQVCFLNTLLSQTHLSNSLCRLRWSWILDFPDSISEVIEFQACTATPGSCCPGYQIQDFVRLGKDKLNPIHSPVKTKLLRMRDNFLQMCELLCLIRQCKFNLIGLKGEGRRRHEKEEEEEENSNLDGR